MEWGDGGEGKQPGGGGEQAGRVSECDGRGCAQRRGRDSSSRPGAGRDVRRRAGLGCMTAGMHTLGGKARQLRAAWRGQGCAQTGHAAATVEAGAGKGGKAVERPARDRSVGRMCTLRGGVSGVPFCSVLYGRGSCPGSTLARTTAAEAEEKNRPGVRGGRRSARGEGVSRSALLEAFGWGRTQPDVPCFGRAPAHPLPDPVDGHGGRWSSRRRRTRSRLRWGTHAAGGPTVAGRRRRLAACIHPHRPWDACEEGGRSAIKSVCSTGGVYLCRQFSRDRCIRT